MARKSKCSSDYGHLVLILLISLTVLVSSVQSRALRKSRRSMASEETSSSTPVKYCSGNSPCGWAVYVPATRTVDYFMRNTCVCPKDKGCLKTDDDLSVSAYVYRCRPET